MGIYLKKHLDNGADIYVWDITETEEKLLNLSSVPGEELEEIQMIKSPARRKEKLAIRALLNEVFPEKVYLGHHDNGKPYIQNSCTEISISHTQRFAAIIIHPEEDMGIDIESLERDFSVVEKKALSEEEVDDLGEKNLNLQLAIYWCAKEAIYKRMSQHGVDFAEQIEIERFTPRESGELEATFTHDDGDTDQFELEYMIFENHVMVWLTD